MPEVPRSILRAARPASDTRVGRIAVPAKWFALSYARRRRRRIRGATVVCVTGSVGKTTTKHVLAAFLGASGTVAANRGGSNRARALISTLRRAADAEYVVQEIGATGPRTLDELLWTLEPDVAVVTAVATDHFAAFKSLDNIAHEKAKAVATLPSDGVAVLNADDPRVLEMARYCRGRVVTYGEARSADVRIADVLGGYPSGVTFRAETSNGALDVSTRMLGRHQVGAVAAAIATGLALECDLEAGLAATAALEPMDNRLSLLDVPGGPTFILDDRKASLATLAPAFAALEVAETTGRKVVVLGQISDGRREPRRLYRDAARDARAVADLVVLVGRWAHHGLRARANDADGSIIACETVSEAADFLRGELRDGDLVLTKGSRDYDHLTRTALQFVRPVGCWSETCRRRTDCQRCRLLERRA
jgi:UDP-N-acetylmuramoyl-tripeptide--D-alanyl-D-alanine ligase